MSRSLATAFALIGLLAFTLSSARSQQVNSSTVIAAPKWHAGEWWRVRTALMTGGTQTDDNRPMQPIHDSSTASIIYRFTVLGQSTLKYEEQDGTYHIGQSTPPERCWVVKISIEPGPYASAMPASYRVYFRIDDLSVREIVQEGQKKRPAFFLFTGTSVDDDKETQPTITTQLPPYIDEQAPCPVWAWPVFPFGSGQVQADQSVAALPNGVKVTLGPLGSPTYAVHQTWFPGMPWWSISDVGGLRESKLIETSDHSFASRERL